VHISVLRPAELGPGEIAAWHAMQRQNPGLASPFLCPEFAIAVGGVRSAARVAVLSDGAAVTGFFPFERRPLGVGVPIGAGLTDCQGLIHPAGMEWEPRKLLAACKVAVWHFDHLVAGQRPFESYTAAVAPSPVIDLTGGFAAYQAQLQAKSPQFCKDLARKARKLEREAGQLRFVTDSRDLAALRALMAWKSDQYRRTGRPDRFDRSWVVGLVDALFAARGEHFSGLLSVLYAGDAPVAAHFGLRSGPLLAHWFPAYDPAFARQSPGLIQHLRMVEETSAAGVRLIDMGKGAKRYKETLKTGDLLVAEGTVTRGSALAAVHRLRSAPAAWAVRQIRQRPPLFHAADLALRRYGRIRSALRPPPPARR